MLFCPITRANTNAHNHAQSLTTTTQQIGHWINTLKELAGGGHRPDAFQRRDGARAALECLKELADAFVPAQLMIESGAVAAVRAFAANKNAAVAAAAKRVLAHWRAALAGHLVVLTEPAYCGDPEGALEADVRAGRVPLPTLPAARRAALAEAAAAAAKGGGGFLTPAPPGGRAGAGGVPSSAPAAVGGGVDGTPAEGQQLFGGETPMQVDG